MKIKLNWKKGFTLVELIVVIAIIGVLAAVLIPTMIGYTIQAKVTSADSTAAKIQKSISYFLTEADVNGYGFKPAAGNFCNGTITVTGSVWTVTITDGVVADVFFSKNVRWLGSGSGTAGDSKVTDCAEEILAITLADSLPDIDTAKIGFRIENGNCCACYFTAETDGNLTVPTFGTNGWSAASFAWDGFNRGISAEGYVVGTAPTVAMN